MTNEKAIEIMQDMKNHAERTDDKELMDACDTAIKALEQTQKTWGLDDAREDFMNDVYNTLDFLPTNNEANRIIDSFDRVTSGLEQQACEDTVSRQAVLDTLDKMDKALDTDRTVENYKELLTECYKNLPPVTPKEKTGWIPVSERLPEKDGYYYVSGNGKIWSCRFVNLMYVKGWTNSADNPPIEAWMPLPESYREVNE